MYRILLLITFFSIFLSGCANKDHSNSIKVGVSPGPQAEVMYAVKSFAKTKGLDIDIQILEYGSYQDLNLALQRGDISANCFQTEVYLKNYKQSNMAEITSLGRTFIIPMKLYAKNIKSLSTLPLQAKVAIPNDPTNNARSLQLLEQAGLIRLNPEAGACATVGDIITNSKQLQFVELELTQLPASIDVYNIVVSNAFIAADSNLNNNAHILYVEPTTSPYAFVFVVQSNANNPQLQQLIDLYHSPEISQFIKEYYRGLVLPAW